MKKHIPLGAVLGGVGVCGIVALAVTRATTGDGSGPALTGATSGGPDAGSDASADAASRDKALRAMHAKLTSEERLSIKSMPLADREFFTRLYYYSGDRLTGDARELEPFLQAVETHRVLGPKEAETPEWQSSYTRTVSSMALLGRAWVQVGPTPELKRRLTAAACKVAAEKDETAKYCAACVLVSVRDYPAAPLPPEAARTLDSLMQNDFVNHLIATRWYEEMDRAAAAVGRLARSPPGAGTSGNDGKTGRPAAVR